jgi:hypothetical protein
MAKSKWESFCYFFIFEIKWGVGSAMDLGKWRQMGIGKNLRFTLHP